MKTDKSPITRLAALFLFALLPLALFSLTFLASKAMATDTPATPLHGTDFTDTAENQAKPSILASIKPLQLILKALVADVVEVELLLPASANPHYYQLRPSDIKKLHTTDHFFWIGPQMEVFLPKVIGASRAPNSSLMSLAEAGSSEKAHVDALKEPTREYSETNEAHQHTGADPHLWLDLMQVAAVSKAITHKLSSLYPEKSEQFQKNQREFVSRLQELHDEYAKKFKSQQMRPIFTSHDAFSRLEDEFGLHIQDFISATPEARPGAAHLARLQKQIAPLQSICYLQDDLQAPSYIDVIADSVDVHRARVDLLAAGYPVTATAYIEYLSALLATVAACALQQEPVRE
jgi:zinc transport system substrate-binding protein